MKTRNPRLKDTLKDAIVERLLQDRKWLAEVVSEALEDFALAEAIREGQRTKRVPREQIFRTLRGEG